MSHSDSITVLKNSIKVFSLDSLDARTKKIEQLVSKIDDKSVWTILFPIIATAVIGFIITWVLKMLDRKSEKKKEKNIIYINCQYIKNSLYFLLSQLAYLKCDAQLQYWYSKNDDTEENKKKALDEYYNDYQLMLKLEEKIGQTCSEYLSIINKFEKLHPEDLGLLLWSEQFRLKMLSLEGVVEYTEEPSRERTDSDIQDLQAKFYIRLEVMADINNKLKENLN